MGLASSIHGIVFVHRLHKIEEKVRSIEQIGKKRCKHYCVGAYLIHKQINEVKKHTYNRNISDILKYATVVIST